MSVVDDFLITTVAKVIESRNVVEDYEKDTTFLYRGEVYQKLIDWKDFNRIFSMPLFFFLNLHFCSFYNKKSPP